MAPRTTSVSSSRPGPSDLDAQPLVGLLRGVLQLRLLIGLVIAVVGLATHPLDADHAERFGIPLAALVLSTVAELQALPRLGPARPRLALLAGDAVIALAVLMVAVGDPAAVIFPIGTAALAGILLGARAVPIWLGLAVQAGATAWAVLADHDVTPAMQLFLLSAPVLCVGAGIAALTASDIRLARQGERREPPRPSSRQSTALGVMVGLTAFAVPFLPAVLVDDTVPGPAATAADPPTLQPSLLPPPSPPHQPTSVTRLPTPTPTRTPTGTPPPQPTPTSSAGSSAAPPKATEPTKKTTTKATAKPVPTFAPRVIAAVDPANTRVGVEEVDCLTCAAGARIGYLAGDRSLTVPVTGVNLAGDRQLTILYESGDHARDLYLDVNGGADRRLADLPKTADWQTPGTTRLTIVLKKGANTLTFHNPVGPAPDLDQFRIS